MEELSKIVNGTTFTLLFPKDNPEAVGYYNSSRLLTYKVNNELVCKEVSITQKKEFNGANYTCFKTNEGWIIPVCPVSYVN